MKRGLKPDPAGASHDGAGRDRRLRGPSRRAPLVTSRRLLGITGGVRCCSRRILLGVEDAAFAPVDRRLPASAGSAQPPRPAATSTGRARRTWRTAGRPHRHQSRHAHPCARLWSEPTGPVTDQGTVVPLRTGPDRAARVQGLVTLMTSRSHGTEDAEDLQRLGGDHVVSILLPGGCTIFRSPGGPGLEELLDLRIQQDRLVPARPVHRENERLVDGARPTRTEGDGEIGGDTGR